MYYQFLIMGEPTTDDCKSLITHRTLDIDSRIDEMKSMEGDPLKGEN
jgi:hypothetical protein